VALGAYCHGKPDPNAQANAYALQASNLQLLNTLDYEEQSHSLYSAGNAGMGQDFYVVHVYGSPYAMGYAHGKLLRPQIQAFMTEVWDYLVDALPLHEIFPGVDNMTLDLALDETAKWTAPYTPPYWYEEMRGLSDGSGVDYETILRVHMLPELTKGSCSMFGAWGDAIPDKTSMLQLRALDWDVDGPFKDYPAIVVYHPSEMGSNVFANIGFVGWVASITGVSEARMSISEIGVSYPDDTFGRESRRGYPFVFVLRDILQFDHTVEQATQRLEDTHRTCDLILGAGSGKEPMFRAYEYSYSTLNVYDDQDMMPYNETWHPRIDNVVYYGMDWLCPGYSSVLSEQLQEYYGSITAENAYQNIVAKTQTGNLHVALYDYPNDRLLISWHAKSGDNNANQNAYSRPYTEITLTDLFQ
jgi:hypothetical protein